MQISSLLLLSAFLATATGQTLTYEFPRTGRKHHWEYPQVCVKGAKWADLITTNKLGQEEFRYDISSTDFREGDQLDGRWGGRYAVHITDSCKGGILFQRWSTPINSELDLTLKATLGDGETKLTVCAFIGNHGGSWWNSLPPLGFTRSRDAFRKIPSQNYNQKYNRAKPHNAFKVNTFCRDFVPDSAIDGEYFSEPEPLPAKVSYTFPEVGTQGTMMGICIKRAQFASATNSVADYPEYKMSSRQLHKWTNIWWDGFFWETNRNTGDGLTPMADRAWSAHRQGWTPGNPCEGALYLQPQRREQNAYWIDNGVNAVMQESYSSADQERLGKNKITVEILPENNESSVEICALVSTDDALTSNWNNLGDYGFTNYGDNTGIANSYVYCKDVSVTSSTSSPTDAPTSIDNVVCPSDVNLLRTDGVTAYPEIDLGIAPAVSILSQSGSEVTVELRQAWETPFVEKFFYEFMHSVFSEKCFESDNVEKGKVFDTITIQCMAMSQTAFLTICLQDSSGSFLDSNDNGMVGKCCQSDALEGTPTVCYHLEIKCETGCLEETTRARYLRAP